MELLVMQRKATWFCLRQSKMGKLGLAPGRFAHLAGWLLVENEQRSGSADAKFCLACVRVAERRLAGCCCRIKFALSTCSRIDRVEQSAAPHPRQGRVHWPQSQPQRVHSSKFTTYTRRRARAPLQRALSHCNILHCDYSSVQSAMHPRALARILYACAYSFSPGAFCIQEFSSRTYVWRAAMFLSWPPHTHLSPETHRERRNFEKYHYI